MQGNLGELDDAQAQTSRTLARFAPRLSREHAGSAPDLHPARHAKMPLRRDADSLEWRVPVADVRMLARWVVANGPGIRIVSPADASEALESGLREVAVLHDRD